MTHLAKAAKLTADLIQRRDDYKRLTGDRFDDLMREARGVVRGVAKEDGIDIADAALKIAKRMSDKGHDPSIIMAAFVEECEATR